MPTLLSQIRAHGAGSAVRSTAPVVAGTAGAPATHSAILTSNGRRLTTLPADLLAEAVAVHRADLHAGLREAADEVRLGVEVT